MKTEEVARERRGWRRAGLAALALAAASAVTWSADQSAAPIPLIQEPHHHRVLHNKLVNVYRLEVQPHDSVILHRHEYDAISVMLGDAQVIVRAPGKPEAPAKLSEAQVRLQPKGYVHSTYIDGTSLYRNVTVELLREQHNPRNVCAAVLAGQPLHCTAVAGDSIQPQYATDETAVALTSVAPHEEAKFATSAGPALVVAVGPVQLTSGGKAREMKSGDFAWLNKGAVASVRNQGDKPARYVGFTLKP